MIQEVVKLVGIQNCSNFTSFAATSRVSTFKGVVCVRFGSMGSKRLRSKSSASGKLSDEERGVDHNESLGVDTDTTERLTVQQLRVKLRSAGIPTKGSKKELVSTWKNYLNSQKDGTSFLGLKDQESSDKKSEALPIAVHGSSINNVSEVSCSRKTNRRVKEGSDTNKKVDTKTIQFSSTQEQSIECLEMPGKRVSGAKRNISSEVCPGYSSKAVIPVVEPWTVLAHKKPQKGWVAYNPRTMRPPPLTRDTKHLKLMSWNVNGLRALLKLESFSALELAKREDFDVLCLQETKLQEKDVEAAKQGLFEGYDNSFWTCSVSKLGYSGTAVISRVQPLSVRYGLGIPDHDTEGRLVTVEFDNFYLLSGYVPNSGDGLKRLGYRTTQWDPDLGNYMKELEKSKPVILTGDLNCAHEEIDIYNPAGNRRSAGFTDEERQSFETNFLNKGFVDTFRRQHPGVVGYTYWGYRHGARKANKGWRLDYFLVSEVIADNVHDSYILPDVTGSDHSPIGLVLKV